MCLAYVLMKLDGLERKIDALTQLTKQVIKKEIQMSVQFDELIQEVEETKTVQQSAVVALTGLVAKVDELAQDLAEAGIDNAKVIELRDALSASTDALAAAIPANTPVE